VARVRELPVATQNGAKMFAVTYWCTVEFVAL